MLSYLKRTAPHLAIVLLVAGLQWAGVLDRLEFPLMDARFAMLEREASRDIVVVEIDERSLRLLDVWPWPRDYHAQVIDRLHEAGASLIAVDVDFSSRSNENGDAALEAALVRAGGSVVLPVFRQYSGLERDRRTLADTGPKPRFAQHVRLGSVAVRPESDSLIRRALTSLPWSGQDVASFPVLLAGIHPGVRSFYIDFGIGSETIPRISYVDVMRGEFPEGMFRGRAVIVGASAVELGDQLAVPRHYSLPGPFVLALSAESLLQGRALQRTGVVPTMVVALLLALLLGPRFAGWSWWRGLIVVFGCVGGFFILAASVQAFVPVSLDTGAWMLVPLLSYGQSLVVVIDRQALKIFRQRMAVLHRSALMRRIVESSFDAVITTDHTGKIDLFNRAAERMFGYLADDVMGKPPDFLFDLQDPEDKGPMSPARLLNGEEDSYPSIEGDGLRKDGSRFAVEMSVRRTVFQVSRNPLERRVENRRIHVFTVRDVTVRRETEEARELAIEEASAANRAKSEFLAAVSHELRTPLNAVIGFSEIIKEQILGEVGNQDYVTYAADIHMSGTRLMAIINDILDISRIEAGNRELIEEEVSIREVVVGTVRTVKGRPEAEGREVSVDIAAGVPNLLADERALKQILSNLLTNALKFSDEGGRVVAKAAVGNHGVIVISVADNGIGIPADVMKNITQPFYQVDSSLSRKYEGTGLGLPLVKSLVELHGGELRIDSTVGVGTTVSCRFPAERVVSPHLDAAE